VQESVGFSICQNCDESQNSIELVSSNLYELDASYIWSTGEMTASIETNISGNYSVTVTFNGFESTESIIDFPCELVGVEDRISARDFKIYPILQMI